MHRTDARLLAAQGPSCEVVAPSSIPRRTGDRLVKTGLRDAKLPDRLLRSGHLTAVRVSGVAVRDLATGSSLLRCCLSRLTLDGRGLPAS